MALNCETVLRWTKAGGWMSHSIDIERCVDGDLVSIPTHERDDLVVRRMSD